MREFRKLEQSLTMLADNEQWLADNLDKLVPLPEPSEATLEAHTAGPEKKWCGLMELVRVADEVTPRNAGGLATRQPAKSDELGQRAQSL